MDVDNILTVPKVATWCKGVVAKLTRATSNPLMRKYLGYVSQRLDAGEYTSPTQYWDEVYRSINAVEDPVNQGRLNPTMDEDKIAFRGFETVYSLAALDPEDRATYFESWFTEDVDHSRAGATEVKAALAECDVFFKDMSDDDVDKCIDIVRQNAGKFPVDSRHFLESFPAPGTMHHSRRKAADKSKEGSGISLSIGDGTLSDEEMVERRVRSAMSKRLTAEELRSDIERTMDKELRASYGPLYTTPSGALVRDVFREPIERDGEPDTGTDKGKANGGSGGSSSSSKAKTTAELRAEAEETYKQRKAAYYEACPLSLDLVSYCPLSHLVHTVRELLYLSDAHAVKTRYLIHLCGCIPIQPKVLWNILKDEVMWCSPHSGMELALRKTKALKVVEDDEGEGKKSYIPRDLMKQIEHLIRDLGSNATVDKLMRQLDWGKNSEKKERLGPLREVLGRLPRVFYEPEYMFLRQSLEGVVAWPEDDERSEEAKTQEMTNNSNNWCRFSVNRAEVANNLVTMLSTPESCPQRRYPLDTARTYLATNGVNPDHELPLLTDLFIPGNNVYLRRGCEDEDQSSSSTSSSAAAAANGQHLWRELGRSESQNPEGPRIREALEAQCALRQRFLEVAKAVKHHAGRSRDTIDRRNARLREALRGAHTTSTGDQQQQAATTTNNNNGPYADLTRPIPPAVSPPLPVDPSVRLVRVDANRSFCIKSSMMPIVLTCEVKPTEDPPPPTTTSRSSAATGSSSSSTQLVRHQRWKQQQQQQQQQQSNKDIRQYMFKVGDDLRQDQLILQLITVMDTLFKKYGLDLRLTPYKVVALSPRDGMIEFVSKSRTLSSALRENGNNLMTYFKHCAKASSGPQANESARLKEILETFSRSCAGYCVITYVLGIGDRHLDNLMVDDEGHMFHVDFGYIFGRDPKPLPPPMKLCKEMVEGMGGQSSEYFRLFRQYCYSAFRILRMNSKLILSLVGLVQGANIKDLVEQDPQMVLSRMEQKLAPEISEEEAESRFLGLINDSTNALFPVVMEKLHQWALYWS